MNSKQALADFNPKTQFAATIELGKLGYQLATEPGYSCEKRRLKSLADDLDIKQVHVRCLGGGAETKSKNAVLENRGGTWHVLTGNTSTPLIF